MSRRIPDAWAGPLSSEDQSFGLSVQASALCQALPGSLAGLILAESMQSDQDVQLGWRVTALVLSHDKGHRLDMLEYC